MADRYPAQHPPAPDGPHPDEPRTVADEPARTHRWGLPAFLAAEAAFLGLSVLLVAPFVDPVTGALDLDARTILLLTVVPTVAAATIAFLFTWRRGNGPRRDLGLVWSWRDVGLGLAFGFGGLFLSAAAMLVWLAVVGPDQTSAIAEILDGQRASLPVAAAVLVAIVVVGPFCEEVLYRGLLWGAVEKRWGTAAGGAGGVGKLGAGPWTAFAVTTVVFAFAHLEPVRAPLLLVVAIPIGLARLLTGRLLASIVAHQFNNLLPGIVLFLGLLGVELPTPA